MKCKQSKKKKHCHFRFIIYKLCIINCFDVCYPDHWKQHIHNVPVCGITSQSTHKKNFSFPCGSSFPQIAQLFSWFVSSESISLSAFLLMDINLLALFTISDRTSEFIYFAFEFPGFLDEFPTLKFSLIFLLLPISFIAFFYFRVPFPPRLTCKI